MDFRLLGPLEVWRDGERVPLGAPKQQAVLAVLLLHVGEVVSTDRLIDELWGERAPLTAVKSLQVYISGLRKAIGAELLQTRARGYVLEVEPDQVDLTRFERLLELGRELLGAGDARDAAATLRDALGLWRGQALGEFADEPFAQSEIVRLAELRVAALEERVEADLALGRHADLVSELEALSREHPLRERVQCHLMLALYRSGRQAEALAVSQHARTTLDDELGLEPGRMLQDLERSILRQDPELESPVSRRRRAVVGGRRRAPLVIAAGAALVLVAAAAAAIVELTGSTRAALVSVAPNSVAAIDAATNRIVAAVPVGTTPSSIAVAEGAVWVLNADDRTVSKVDAGRTTVEKAFSTGGEPPDLAVGDGAVWVGNGTPASSSQVFGGLVPVALTRIDAGSAAVDGRVRLPRGASGLGGRAPGQHQIAVGGGVVWALGADGSVARIDPRSHRVVTRIPALQAVSLAVDGADLWVATGDHAVVRIDTRSNRVRERVPLATFTLGGIAVGAGAVWVTDPVAGTLWRIDPRPGPVARTIAVGSGAFSVAVGAGAVWVVNGLDATLLRVDPRKNRVVARIPIPGTPREVAVGSGRVWVSVAAGATAAQPATGAPREEIAGALPASICGHVSYGEAGSPQLLIASDLPLQSGPRGSSLPEAQAIAFVLARHRFRAGRFRVGYQSCDDSTTQAGGEDPVKCTANAKLLAGATEVVGVIGPFGSGCASAQIPIANRAPAGPLAMLSLSNSYVGLTRHGVGVPPDHPDGFYPTGVRNYTRLSPTDDYQGAAHALLARDLGARRAFVLQGTVGAPYGEFVAAAFRRAAPALGVRVVGAETWSPSARSYLPLARRIERTQPDAVFLSGVVFDRAGPLVKQLRATLGREVELLAPDGFAVIPELTKTAGSAAHGMYVSILGRPNSALGPAGQRFLAAFALTQADGIVPSYTAAYAAQAAEVLLAAIARSDGTRASVTRELLGTRVKDGILGTFRFDRHGDTTLNPITILRVTGTTTRSPTGLTDQIGSVLERVISPPGRLVHGG
jgi:DNA-binding SARP family transcriptional activator/ABC-type branched-subunit amino acid transport system substrate-binding protein